MQKKGDRLLFYIFLLLILYKKVACPLFSSPFFLPEGNYKNQLVVINFSLPNTALASISKYP
jgi:hypothetical protein